MRREFHEQAVTLRRLGRPSRGNMIMKEGLEDKIDRQHMLLLMHTSYL